MKSLYLLVFFFALACSSAQALDAPLKLLDGHVVAPIPGQMAIAAYVSLENVDDEAVELVAVATPVAGRASLHQTQSDGNMSRMTSLENIRIGSGEQLQMNPGGIHLMLMEPDLQALSAERVEIRFTLQDGRSQIFLVPVRSILDSSTDSHSHSHH